MRIFINTAAIFLILFFALAPRVSAWETYIGKNLNARVVGTPESNIVEVRDRAGQKLAIRLYGIGIPTLRQPLGDEAHALISRILAPGTSVTLTTVNQDEEGIISALVQVRDRSLNNQLVSEGLAWVDRGTCKAFFCRRWHIEEHLAQKERRGIWGLRISTPPWQWGEIENKEDNRNDKRQGY